MSTNGKIKINLDSLKSRREWKRHKVTDGNNVFRILPPFGENSNGYPYRKWQIIWGLFDPESGRARPFASSMTSEKKCPVTEYVQQLKKKAETIKAQMQAAGESEDEIKNRLSTLNKLISDLNPKTVYIYNAADQSGEVGLLELKSTAHKKMKTEMSNYINDYNQDPTSLNSDENDSGVWFNVVRTGMGRDTEYDVKRVSIKTKNPQTGKISFEDDRSPLPESVVENYENMAYDLSSVYQVKSYDELNEILEANMTAIVEACPDADLNATIAFEKQILGNNAKQTPSRDNSPTGTMRAGKKPVNLNLGSDDDDEDEAVVSKTTTKTSVNAVKASSSVDDDFLAEADALLNS
jgi:hypothetical protein